MLRGSRSSGISRLTLHTKMREIQCRCASDTCAHWIVEGTMPRHFHAPSIVSGRIRAPLLLAFGFSAACGTQEQPRHIRSEVIRPAALSVAVAYAVNLPPNTVAGQAVNVTVTAKDSAGITVTTYSGQVH